MRARGDEGWGERVMGECREGRGRRENWMRDEKSGEKDGWRGENEERDGRK